MAGEKGAGAVLGNDKGDPWPAHRWTLQIMTVERPNRVNRCEY